MQITSGLIFYKGDQLPDLLYRKGRTGIIALGTLNGYKLCLFIDSLCNIFVVKGSVGKKIHLAVGNAVFL